MVKAGGTLSVSNKNKDTLSMKPPTIRHNNKETNDKQAHRKREKETKSQKKMFSQQLSQNSFFF